MRHCYLNSAVAILWLLSLPALAGVNLEQLTSQGINPNAARAALNFYDRHDDQFKNNNYLTIIDYTLPSNRKRFYLIDNKSGEVVKYFVGHGRGSGKDRWVERVANTLPANKQVGSLRTPVGAFKTLWTKRSRTSGYSLTLKGLQTANRTAFERYIYVHGSKKVSPDSDYVLKHGQVALSEGCFMLEKRYNPSVIAKIKNGSFLFAYWDKEEMEANKLTDDGSFDPYDPTFEAISEMDDLDSDF